MQTIYRPVPTEPDIGATGHLHETNIVADLVAGLKVCVAELEKAGLRFPGEGETIASDVAKIAAKLQEVYATAV